MGCKRLQSSYINWRESAFVIHLPVYQIGMVDNKSHHRSEVNLQAHPNSQSGYYAPSTYDPFCFFHSSYLVRFDSAHYHFYGYDNSQESENHITSTLSKDGWASMSTTCTYMHSIRSHSPVIVLYLMTSKDGGQYPNWPTF